MDHPENQPVAGLVNFEQDLTSVPEMPAVVAGDSLPAIDLTATDLPPDPFAGAPVMLPEAGTAPVGRVPTVELGIPKTAEERAANIEPSLFERLEKLERQYFDVIQFANTAVKRIKAAEAEIASQKMGGGSGLSPEAVHILKWASIVLSKWFAKEKPVG